MSALRSVNTVETDVHDAANASHLSLPDDSLVGRNRLPGNAEPTTSDDEADEEIELPVPTEACAKLSKCMYLRLVLAGRTVPFSVFNGTEHGSKNYYVPF